MGVHLATTYEADRQVSVPSHTNDGGQIVVPYLAWTPGSTEHPCEAPLPEPPSGDGSTYATCGLPLSADVHLKLVAGDHHEYLAYAPQPGMYLVLDSRLGFTIPKTVSQAEADELVEFIANAIAIGAGYASIYYTKRKMPFRG